VDSLSLGGGAEGGVGKFPTKRKNREVFLKIPGVR